MQPRRTRRPYAARSPRRIHRVVRLLAVPPWALSALLVCSKAHGAGKEGDVLETNTLGMNLVTRDLTAHATRTVADAANLSEQVGLHYYVADRLRLGMSFQLAERLAPPPATGSSRLQRVAFLPQVGFGVCGPLFVAVVFAYAPRTEGIRKPTLGAGGIVGAAVPLSNRVNASFAVEVPWTFYRHQMIGLTSLLGVSVRL
jgi:hypothetical protein